MDEVLGAGFWVRGGGVLGAGALSCFVLSCSESVRKGLGGGDEGFHVDVES